MVCSDIFRYTIIFMIFTALLLPVTSRCKWCVCGLHLLGRQFRISPGTWMPPSCECCQVEVRALGWSISLRALSSEVCMRLSLAVWLSSTYCHHSKSSDAFKKSKWLTLNIVRRFPFLAMLIHKTSTSIDNRLLIKYSAF